MSHHEENYDERMFAMERHLYRVLYTEDFKSAWETYTGQPFDYRNVRLWYGPIQSYWLKQGKQKKYTTLVLDYHGKQMVYEQDSLDSPAGEFHDLK